MARPINSQKVNVLVIEDNDDHWSFIETAIQETSSEIVATRVISAGAEAFLQTCLVEQWNMPKLILQDLYLPSSKDALTLVSRVKAISASLKLIPIIVLSSSNIQVDIVKAYEAGIASYLLRPTSIDGWISLFKDLCTYWLETATLPPQYYSLF